MRANRGRLASSWLIGALVFAAAFWVIDLGVHRAGAPHPLDDNWEDNLIAAHLLGGDGFRTHLIYPPLWTLRDPATNTVPVLIHGPLLALLTAPVLAALGPAALDHVAWAAGLCALLAVIPIFRIGARYFGDPVGAAAAALFTLSPLTLGAVHHSGSVVLGALLVAWTLDFLARAEPRTVLGGALAGIAYLVRPEMLVALPLLLVLAWRGRIGPLLVLLVAFALPAVPWWIHHARIVGSPFFSLTSYTLIGFWGAYPGSSVLQDFALAPKAWPSAFAHALPSLPAKWASFFPHAVKHALFVPSGATGWLALVGLGMALADPRRARGDRPDVANGSIRRFAACALLLALVPVASMTLTSYQQLYILPFASLWALGAALGASVVVRTLPPWAHRPRAWIGVLVLLVLRSTLPAMVDAAHESQVLRVRLAAERALLARAIPGSTRLVFSDTPDWVAWSTGRPTPWVSREEFERLYPADGRPGEAARFGLPPREQVTGFFHDDPREPGALGRVVPP